MRLPPRLDRVAYWAAPIALLLGVAFQRYNVVVHDQTPWVGGGFGMFSTVDVPGARLLRTYLLTDRGPVLVLDPALGDDRRLVYSQPKEDRLDRAANTVASRDWAVYSSDQYAALRPYFPEAFQRHLQIEEGRGGLPRYVALASARAPEAVEPVEAVVRGAQVEVWRSRFDRSEGRIVPERLRAARATRLTLPLDR